MLVLSLGRWKIVMTARVEARRDDAKARCTLKREHSLRELSGLITSHRQRNVKILHTKQRYLFARVT